ncbi:MAG: STAS domain-containing protein [Nitrospirae bacterium]|nr:STAS domain-containing protein [Nitrospirota bacterium]
MDITIRKENSAAVLSLSGRMDAVNAPDFDKHISELLVEGQKKVLIELSGLQYVSSAGLRSFLSAAKQLKAASGAIAFAALQDTVLKVFQMSGFNTIFTVYPTAEEALKSF